MPGRRFAEVACAVVALSTLITPFRRDLFVGDETKYGQVIREMRSTGAFFLPTLGRKPFTHKPPIHFWLIDLLTFPLGVYSMWAFVLPSLIAFALLLWLMWRRGGPLAAFVCATSLLVWASAQTARMDVSFTLLIAAGLIQLERFLDRDDFRALLLCAVALGVATLVKGPMAPVIGIVLFFLEWWRRRRVPRGNYLPAIAALVLIPLAWFIPAMLLGGQAYTHEVIVKQTVGRAVATWVHQAPPWFYLLHLPATLFPWFFLAVAAVIARPRSFLVNWILAVLVPYSLMASKLDVYMMAMIPAVALLVVAPASSPAVEAASRRLPNAIAAAILILAVAGLFAKVPLLPITGLCIATAIAGIVALVIVLRSSFPTGTVAVGLASLVPLLYTAIVLMPRVNDLASTRPLVAALVRQQVPGDQIALYWCPYLWTRDMPRDFERVVYADNVEEIRGRVIATSRAHAKEIAPALAGAQRVDQLQLIGKWFDVYRR
ncbi:MAG TPA: glycosyltransferase family 39 protein [Thermoanaerobaculia bacterium]|nr:glycosyltransferase family 39 protein [Thermoanaerobaculia bacterium]